MLSSIVILSANAKKSRQDDVPSFKKEVKKRVKMTLKMLQRHQIAQNNLVQRRAREEAERKEAEKLQKLQQEAIKNKDKTPSVDTTPQITRPFVRQPEQLKPKEDVLPLIFADRDKFIVDLNKNPIINANRRMGRDIGNSIDAMRRLATPTQLNNFNPEIMHNLDLDRLHAKERARRLPEMMNDIDRRRMQEFRELAKKMQPQRVPPKQLGR